MDSQATAGRIVHYTDATGKSVAAIVNRDVGPTGVAQLTTFYETGPVAMPRVQYSEEPQPGYWSWMPYQKVKAELPDGNQSESAEPRPPIAPLGDWTNAITDRLEHLESQIAYLQDITAVKGPEAPRPDITPDSEKQDGGGPELSPKTTEGPPAFGRVDDTPDTVESGPPAEGGPPV